MRGLLIFGTIYFFLVGGNVGLFSGRSTPTPDEVRSDLILTRLTNERSDLWWFARLAEPTPTEIIERNRLLIRYRTARMDQALLVNAEALSQATDRLRQHQAKTTKRPTWFTEGSRWERFQQTPVGWTRG